MPHTTASEYSDTTPAAQFYACSFSITDAGASILCVCRRTNHNSTPLLGAQPEKRPLIVLTTMQTLCIPCIYEQRVPRSRSGQVRMKPRDTRVHEAQHRKPAMHLEDRISHDNLFASSWLHSRAVLYMMVAESISQLVRDTRPCSKGCKRKSAQRMRTLGVIWHP